jgi:hypothetical protein
MAEQTLVSSTNGGSIDWCLPHSVLLDGKTNSASDTGATNAAGREVEVVELFRRGTGVRTKMWEIPRVSTTTGYEGSTKLQALTRSDSFFVDGGRYTTQNMGVSWGPINTSALLPDTFNIQKLGFKLEWNGARKDSGKVMYVRFAFTTNGTAIPDKSYSFTNNTGTTIFMDAFVTDYNPLEGTDFQYGTGYKTWPEILYFDLPCDVTELTITAVVGMRTNDNSNGGGGFRLTLNNIN